MRACILYAGAAPPALMSARPLAACCARRVTRASHGQQCTKRACMGREAQVSTQHTLHARACPVQAPACLLSPEVQQRALCQASAGWPRTAAAAGAAAEGAAAAGAAAEAAAAVAAAAVLAAAPAQVSWQTQTGVRPRASH